MTTHQGKSLMPILRQKAVEHKDYVFAEFLVDNKAMVCTKEWKYIFTTGTRDLGQGYATGFGPSGILHRLYNIKNDPNETTDLAKKPEHHEILQNLQTTMIQHFKNTDPRAPQLPENLSVNETLAWFCEPPEGNETVDSM
jgi:hypothetical protein